MAAPTKSKVTPKYKTKYRVTSWRAYEQALKKRVTVTVWFDEGAVSAWNASSIDRRPGGKRLYSSLAIVTALTLRSVFDLPLRQTEGFVGSLIRLMGLDLQAPDHTTLSRRSATVVVPSLNKTQAGPIHLVIDSTGLKMLGDGEWHNLKHRTSNKRRSWRKLHLGVDDQGFIVASKLTNSGEDDATVGAAILKGIDDTIEQFTADGAYDTRAIYEALVAAGERGTTIVIPPRKTGSRSMPPEELFEQRDAALARIAEVGRRQWRKEAGAHRQARAENAMLRYKRIIGDSLRSKGPEAQSREAKIGGWVLNKMTLLGRPESVKIVA